MMKRIINIFIFCAAATIAVSCGNDRDFPALESSTMIGSIQVPVKEPKLPIILGRDTTLVATFSPQDATFPYLAWRSEDPTIASVDKEGVIKANKVGETRIIVSPGVGYATQAVVEVVVVERQILMTGLSFVGLDANPEVFNSAWLDVEVEITPAQTTFPTLEWDSEDKTIATVSNGRVVGKGVGTTTITAKSTDGSNVSRSFDIVVKPAVGVTSVTVTEPTTPFTLEEARDFTLEYTFEPANATPQTIAWTSSNPNVANVEFGKIIPVGCGSTTITATAPVTGQSQSVKVDIPWGYINDIYFTNSSVGPWKASANNVGPVAYNSGVMNVAFTRSGANYFGFIIRNQQGTLHSDYPVYAFKTTMLHPKTWITLDFYGNPAGGGGAYGGGSRNESKYYTTDGCQVTYVDFMNEGKAFGSYPMQTGVPQAFTMQMKIGDLLADGEPANDAKGTWQEYLQIRPDGTYDLYWVKTFKSVAAMKAFAPEQQ